MDNNSTGRNWSPLGGDNDQACDIVETKILKEEIQLREINSVIK